MRFRLGICESRLRFIFPTFPGTPDNRFVSQSFRTQSSWIHGSGDPPNRSAPIRSSKEYVHVLKIPFGYELTVSIEGRLHQQCLDLLLGAGKCSVRFTRKFCLYILFSRHPIPPPQSLRHSACQESLSCIDFSARV